MTAASSICRIRLSCSTTVSTSNWKALAIAVLLPRGEIPDHRYHTIGLQPTGNEQAGSSARRTHHVEHTRWRELFKYLRSAALGVTLIAARQAWARRLL